MYTDIKKVCIWWVKIAYCITMSEEEAQNRTLKDEKTIIPNRRRFLQLTGAAGGAIALGGGTVAGQEDSKISDGDDLPEIRVVGTGGTIASTQEAAEDGGYSLDERAEAIVESVPLLSEIAEITHDQPVDKPSPFLTAEDFTIVTEAIEEAASEGVDGVVVTSGTDAVEEQAFFQDLVLDLDIPVVFVGAMRPADAISADGPANLVSAVRVCARSEFHLSDEPSGVYVVMNDTIHAARDVRKAHTSRVDTFDSGIAGPIGILADGEIVLHRSPGSYTVNLPTDNLGEIPEMNVPIAGNGAGHDAYILEQAIAGDYDVDGIVVATTGNGGTQPPIREATSEAAEEGIPVATSTRVYWGAMSTGPYPEFEEGSPVSMEDIPPWKARLLMMVAISATESHSEISNEQKMVQYAVYESKYGSEDIQPSAY